MHIYIYYTHASTYKQPFVYLCTSYNVYVCVSEQVCMPSNVIRCLSFWGQPSHFQQELTGRHLMQRGASHSTMRALGLSRRRCWRATLSRPPRSAFDS